MFACGFICFVFSCLVFNVWCLMSWNIMNLSRSLQDKRIECYLQTSITRVKCQVHGRCINNDKNYSKGSCFKPTPNEKSRQSSIITSTEKYITQHIDITTASFFWEFVSHELLLWWSFCLSKISCHRKIQTHTFAYTATLCSRWGLINYVNLWRLHVEL